MNRTHKAAETTPERCPDDTAVLAWARLVRVSQALLARVETDLKRAGFPPLACYDALLELRRAGTRGLRPFELQREMLLAQYSISRLVERLCREGYIQRAPASDDGRGQLLTITATGRQLLKQMWPVYGRAIHQHFGRRLAKSDTRKLATLLEKLREEAE